MLSVLYIVFTINIFLILAIPFLHLFENLLDYLSSLSLFNQVLCHALEHLPTLSLHTESVLAVVVKLALHPDRKIRNKLA